MTENECKEFLKRRMVKQLCRPGKKFTLVENHINDEGEKEYIGYAIDFFAVCEDGRIRPVIIDGGAIEVCEMNYDTPYIGIYTDNELREEMKRYKHRFIMRV